MRSRSPRDQGSITAEFAVVMPAVVLVLVTALCTLQFAAQQVQLQEAAAATSRALARGDPGAASTAAAIARGAVISRVDHDGLVCVTAAVHASGVGALVGVVLRASGCALGGGR